ncbi:MAG: ComF family protein [Bacteroidia bacterium]|nr:ComF family protein [Bacteroidia bacterium]
MAKKVLIHWLESLGDLFVMRSCLGCETALTRQEQHLCLGCLEGLEPTFSHHKPDDNDIYRRIAGKVPIAGAFGMFYFDKGGNLQRLLQALKYSEQPEIGVWIGKKYGRELQTTPLITQVNGILPVPLHPKKARKRGYNQAEKICEGLSESLGIPLRTDLLIRTKHTGSQTKLSGQNRYTNVATAFKVVKECPESVLLVDDVITTGATLEACIKALLASPVPPSSIQILSIGVAR